MEYLVMGILCASIGAIIYSALNKKVDIGGIVGVVSSLYCLFAN